jgi:hypothetical protein
MKSISNMFKSTATKNMEAKTNEKRKIDMKILQDNKEHWKKVDDMRAIKSVQTRGLTNENINTINKPDLLNMSDTFRKNDVAHKTQIINSSKMQNANNSIVKQRIAARKYLMDTNNGPIQSSWSGDDIISQAGLIYRMRKLNNQKTNADIEYLAAFSGGKKRNNKKTKKINKKQKKHKQLTKINKHKRKQNTQKYTSIRKNKTNKRK